MTCRCSSANSKHCNSTSWCQPVLNGLLFLALTLLGCCGTELGWLTSGLSVADFIATIRAMLQLWWHFFCPCLLSHDCFGCVSTTLSNPSGIFRASPYSHMVPTSPNGKQPQSTLRLVASLEFLPQIPHPFPTLESTQHVPL